MSRLALGLDVGTQGTKGLVVDLGEGRVVARAARSYGLLPGLPPGAAEQHPDTWTDAVRAVVRELLGAGPGACIDAREVGALGVSGQQHGFVPVDADGAAIRPAKLWCDTSTAAEARELSALWGRAVPTGFTASKVLWLKRHEPASYARLRWILLPHDWVNFRLTGTPTTEAGDASGTGFFDPVRRKFRLGELAALDARLPDALPPLVPPDEPAGRLSADAARELGLAEGTLVAAGGGDNMMSAIGSGVTRGGRAALSLGTSATVFAWSPEPVVDPAGAIAPFCDSTGAWLPLLCVMNATGVLGAVARAFGAEGSDAGDAIDWARWSALAETVEPGSEGLLLLPYLAGERVPDLPEASGTLLGVRASNLRPATLFRAALEGVALNLALGLERMTALGVRPTELRLVGGGAANATWTRILADALALPLVPLAESESAALGAALQAGRLLEGSDSIDALAERFARPAGPQVEPSPAAAGRHAELRERFREALRTLHGPSAAGPGGAPGQAPAHGARRRV